MDLLRRIVGQNAVDDHWGAVVTVCTAAEAQIAPHVVSDSVGGAIIAWQDFRSGTDADIYAQRISDVAPSYVKVMSDSLNLTPNPITNELFIVATDRPLFANMKNGAKMEAACTPRSPSP